MTPFEEKVIESLAELKTDLKGVRDHLSRLNGKVAAQEAIVGQLQLEQARREGAAASTGKWADRLSPAVWAVISVVVMLVLQNAPAVLAAMKH